MKKGLRVSWTLQSGKKGGSGTVITDEVDGQVQVKVEEQWQKDDDGTFTRWMNEMHYVISCTVIWLKPEDTETAAG